MTEVIQVGWKPMGTRSIGPARGLQLEDPQLDPDLEDRSSVTSSDFTGLNTPGPELVGPESQDLVQVAAHRRVYPGDLSIPSTLPIPGASHLHHNGHRPPILSSIGKDSLGCREDSPLGESGAGLRGLEETRPEPSRPRGF